MNISTSKTRLTWLVITLALIQAPSLFYLTEGFLDVIFILSCLLLELVLSVILIVKLVKYKSTNERFHIAGLITGFTLIILLPWEYDMIEYGDWLLLRKQREKVVKEIKEELRDSSINNTYERYRMKRQFLPISRGDFVRIVKLSGDTVSIEFLTDRGFIDDYKAFLYTTNRDEQAAMDKSIKEGKYDLFKKFDDNWYSIHF